MVFHKLTKNRGSNMPIHFMLLGIMTLFILFFVNLSVPRKCLLFCGVACIIGSFFIGQINIKMGSINILNFIGIVLVLCAVISKKCISHKTFVTVFCGVVMYFLLNVISLDYNMFFTFVPICVICTIVPLVLMRDTKASVFSCALSIVACEFVSMFLMYKNLNYWALFGNNFMFCIVLCVYAVLSIKFICCLIRKFSKKQKVVE